MNLNTHLRASAEELKAIYISTLSRGHGVVSREIQGDEAAAEIIGKGYSKPRMIVTRAEANSLPDRAAFITPGEIIFRKWENYYGEGKHAWERELGQMVPAEILSESGHFPATVLWEPQQ